MSKATPRAPRKIPQARLLASGLLEQHGQLALYRASERISFFHSLGDYDSVAQWAKVAAAVIKLQQAPKKRQKRGTVEILPPVLAASTPAQPLDCVKVMEPPHPVVDLCPSNAQSDEKAPVPLATAPDALDFLEEMKLSPHPISDNVRLEANGDVQAFAFGTMYLRRLVSWTMRFRGKWGFRCPSRPAAGKKCPAPGQTERGIGDQGKPPRLGLGLPAPGEEGGRLACQHGLNRK